MEKEKARIGGLHQIQPPPGQEAIFCERALVNQIQTLCLLLRWGYSSSNYKLPEFVSTSMYSIFTTEQARNLEA
jgi:hypothetical protein